jgi:methionyl-tRNA formyltransferase
MGTPDFAIPSLKILLDNHYDIVSVVTVPDKPAGRGLQLSTSAVKQYALKQGLQILQPERMKDEYFIRQLTYLKPDIFVVVAFRILPPEVFQIPKLGSFNLHASLLPKYRGAAPINWAIIRGEKETGVTSFFLQEKVDTGNIILQARVPIGPDENAGELHDKLSDIGAEIVLHTVRLIEAGKISPKLQDDSLASIAPKIFKDHCKIDWDKPSVQIHDLIRGLSPRPGAFTVYDGRILKIYRSQFVDVDKKCTSGEVLQADNKLIIKTNDGAIELLDLQLEGKKRMSAEDFLRGYRLTIGEKFS